jgi:hypothetical protein
MGIRSTAKAPISSSALDKRRSLGLFTKQAFVYKFTATI